MTQGVDVAGYLADPGDVGALPPLNGGVPWLGRPDEAPAVVERYRISQVVFGALPRPADAQWLTLGALRRLRVRLRWLDDGVWLLAAASRAETFGGAPSAVQAAGGRRAAAAFLRRLAGLPAAALLALLTVLPSLWLRLRPLRRGAVALQTVAVCDAWGHALELTLATTPAGRVLPLPWQGTLVGPLLRGRLDLWGSRAAVGAAPEPPRDAAGVIAFWEDQPAPPGLTGPWAAADGPRGAWRAVLGLLWRDPGGFGNLGSVSGLAGRTAAQGRARDEEGET